MKLRRQRELLIAYWLLFDEFEIGNGSAPASPPKREPVKRSPANPPAKPLAKKSPPARARR